MQRRGVLSLISCARTLTEGGILTQTRSLAEAAPAADLKKTPLFDFHVKNGGKMVEFCGWNMPVQYSQSVMESTKHCRKNALLFDVSHMCGLSIRGKDAIPFLEKLVVGDIKAVKPGSGTLSLFTNEQGGIIDDSVITKVTDEDLYLVVNAGRRDVDLPHIQSQLDKHSEMDVEMVVHDERGLFALQGPKASPILQSMVDVDLSKLYFGNFIKADISGVPCWITRTGYTGEDGFECSIPNESLVTLGEKFLSHSDVWLGGLGARDALRLEAGLCLYGNDITDDISPIEAGLTWTIGKSRRADCAFLGGDRIKKELAEGVTKKRIGLFTEGPPARAHSALTNPETGETIGEVTSGAFSPNLGKNIAMGYLNLPFNKKETPVKVSIRNKQYNGVVTGMPFVPTKYYRPS